MSDAPVKNRNTSSAPSGSGLTAKIRAVGFRIQEKIMPTAYNAWVKAMTYGVVIANIVLILTGGLVRLTGSGLGCSTWPRCNGDQWTTTPEAGIHGAIEFGNRMLTFALLTVTLLSFFAIVRIVLQNKISFWQTWGFLFGKKATAFKGLRSSQYRYADLFNLNVLLLWGIILQAVVGGFSVRLRLNPWMVSVHYILTAVMIALSAVLLNRVLRYFEPKVQQAEAVEDAAPPAGAPLMRALAWVSVLLVSFLIFMGTVTTGTGPHAGDPETHRHAFNPLTVTRTHSISVWTYCLVILLLFVLAKKYAWPRAITRSLGVVLLVLLFQAAIGYFQYFNGLPAVAVELHLIGSGLFTWAAFALIERQFTMSSARARQKVLDWTS